MLCIAAVAGCGGGAYYASELPPEFQAPVIANAAKIDLSRFAKPTTTTDLVEAGDLLDVSIATGLEDRRAPHWRLRVDDQGAVLVPIVGPVRLAGLALSDADRAIYDAAVSRGYFRNPNVSVRRVDRRENRIVVAGAVKRPGAYDLPSSSSDVLSALVAAGGLRSDADTIVEVRQPGSPQSPQQNPHAPLQGEQFASHRSDGEKAGSEDEGAGSEGEGAAAASDFQLDLARPEEIRDRDVALADGAVVTVKERPDHVIAVMGKVKRPGHFDMPDDSELRVLDAIALAGGRTIQFADKVYVVRQKDDGSEPLLIRASIADAKSNPAANIRLAPGDVVSIEETPITVGLEAIKRVIRVSLSSRAVLF